MVVMRSTIVRGSALKILEIRVRNSRFEKCPSRPKKKLGSLILVILIFCSMKNPQNEDNRKIIWEFSPGNLEFWIFRFFQNQICCRILYPEFLKIFILWVWIFHGIGNLVKKSVRFKQLFSVKAEPWIKLRYWRIQETSLAY